MKMKPEHYAILEKACKEVLAANPTMPESYKAAGLSPMRLNWDVLHRARINGDTSTRWVCDTLYQYMSDTHINTALKSIMGNNGLSSEEIVKRLVHLRVELRAERISYGELAELQSLAPYIPPSDVELLEAAGVPESQSARDTQASGSGKESYWD